MDESSLLSHPCYHEVWPASLSFAVLIGALWHLSVISLCFSPVTEDIETLSCAYLSSIHFLGRAWDPESQGRGFMSHTEWCVGASLEDQMVLLCSAGDLSLIAESVRSSGEGNGNPLQYLCLENPMDRGAWEAYSSWGRKESGTTKRLTCSLSYIFSGETLCPFYTGCFLTTEFWTFFIKARIYLIYQISYI